MMLIMNGITSYDYLQWFLCGDAGNMQVGDMMAFIAVCYADHHGIPDDHMMSIMLPRANVAAIRIKEVLDTDTI